MILTKDELFDRLHSSAGERTVFDVNALFDNFLEILDWDDDEPRDINEKDLVDFEDIVAQYVDSLLAGLEDRFESD